jgi:hypothetical protein
MPTVDNEIDAHFYELIHSLVGSGKENGKRERRGRQREAFGATHQVAPYDGKKFPEAFRFFDVRCHDLTRAGFSFLMPNRPHFSSLVAAFGSDPAVLYVEARVSRKDDVLFFPSTGRVEHVTRGQGPIRYTRPDGKIGEPRVLVGCQFVRRMEMGG